MARFLPYGRQDVDEADVAAVAAVLRGDWLTTGPAVTAFEEALSEVLGGADVVAVSNGTTALHAACAALGIGPGDRVVVPAITFLATASAPLFCGADVAFADVDPRTGLIDPASVERLIDDRTKAILPVHLGGAPVDTAALAALAEPHGIAILEDAAHALGAVDAGAPVGSCPRSALATFSFHPVKHIATGEGGAVATRDPELARRLRLFRNHGMEREEERLELGGSPGPWWYEQQELGHNFRLCDIQAALGTSQLRRFPAFLARRRALAARYHRLLEGMPGVLPATPSERLEASAWHLMQVGIDFAGHGTDRRSVMEALRARDIGTQVHYIPLPMQPLHRRRGSDPADVPGALAFYEGTLSLPLYPAMADEDVDRVVEALAAALGIAR